VFQTSKHLLFSRWLKHTQSHRFFRRSAFMLFSCTVFVVRFMTLRGNVPTCSHRCDITVRNRLDLSCSCSAMSQLDSRTVYTRVETFEVSSFPTLLHYNNNFLQPANKLLSPWFRVHLGHASRPQLPRFRTFPGFQVKPVELRMRSKSASSPVPGRKGRTPARQPITQYTCDAWACILSSR
jgi:hypothetical protein